jgi:hypothetical protein
MSGLLSCSSRALLMYGMIYGNRPLPCLDNFESCMPNPYLYPYTYMGEKVASDIKIDWWLWSRFVVDHIACLARSRTRLPGKIARVKLPNK